MNDELNDPVRVFESDPKKAARQVVRHQLELLKTIQENHKILETFMRDRRLLDTFPISLTSNPVELATIISAFSRTREIASNYQLAIIAMAVLVCSDEQFKELSCYLI